jgi:hypothetical protein
LILSSIRSMYMIASLTRFEPLWTVELVFARMVRQCAGPLDVYELAHKAFGDRIPNWSEPVICPEGATM